jgi:hypothetical protein
VTIFVYIIHKLNYIILERNKHDLRPNSRHEIEN